jgi:hypothetical protein
VVGYRVKAVVMLDFVLIMMTAVWIIIGVFRGLSNLEVWYNYVYVILNIATLTLNLVVIRK